MYLSIIDKIILVMKYFFSSFLGIEMLVVAFILFLFFILNINYRSNIIKIIIPIILVSILLFISGGFHAYVMNSINSFLKSIMKYYYFPSIALYYIMVVFSIIILIYTLINDNIPKVKRFINYIFLSLLFMLFLGLFSYVIKNRIKLVLDYSIYQNDLILSFVQISNFIFLIWIIISFFLHLYYYFSKKFDVINFE